MDILGKRIRYLREKHQLSQKQLAEKVNLTNAQLSRYELGERKPDPEIIKDIADYFEVSADYLLGRTDRVSDKGAEEDFFNPKLGVFFKEIKNAPEERQEQLRKIWEIIKSEGTRRPGDKQK
ncbi:helix-turn-helix domain-containing protein [Priestia aryabhattai]